MGILLRCLGTGAVCRATHTPAEGAVQRMVVDVDNLLAVVNVNVDVNNLLVNNCGYRSFIPVQLLFRRHAPAAGFGGDLVHS